MLYVRFSRNATRELYTSFVCCVCAAALMCCQAISLADDNPGRDSPAILRAQIGRIRNLEDTREREMACRALLDQLGGEKQQDPGRPPSIRRLIAVAELHLILADDARAAEYIGQATEHLADDLGGALIVADELLRLTADLRRNGATTRADACESEILSSLAGLPEAAGSAYATIERAFIRGQYQLVIRSASVRRPSGVMAFDNFGFLCLRARAAGAQYWEYEEAIRTGGKNAAQDAAQMRSLALACVSAYEAAYSKAPTSYEKAQLSAAWWGLRANARFEADSRLLRDEFPFPSAVPPVSAERLDAQSELFRAAALRALDAGHDGQRLSPATRKEFSTAWAADFRILAHMGPPQELVEDVVRGLPVFCDIGLDGINGEGPVLGATMRWYLWLALTQPMPDEVERAAIDAQVREVAGFVEHNFDEALANPRLIPFASKEAASLLRTYETTKDNRLFPSFKRVLLPHEYARLRRKLNEAVARVTASFREEVGALERKPAAERDDATYKRLQDLYVYTLRVALLQELTYFDRPMLRRHLPDSRITTCYGQMNRHNVYVFVVGKWMPFPDYRNMGLPSSSPSAGD